MMDEVDLALMDDDDTAKTDQSEAQQVQLAAAEPAAVLPRNTLKPNTASDDAAPAFGQIPKPATNGGDIVVLQTDDMTQPKHEEFAAVPVANPDAVQMPDLLHEVKENENLWQIAKSITGDANNWHRIADINNLAPDASVFAGQKLKIPGDIVKPDIGGEDQPDMSDMAETKLLKPVSTAAAQATVDQPVTTGNEPAVALNIPEAKPNAEADAEVAAVEQNSSATSTDAAVKLRDAIELTVGDGETLWNFSKRTTGDATNWRTIAQQNGFSEQQIGMIRPGQKIYVPTDLVRVRDANGNLIAKGEENLVPDANIGGVPPEYEQALAAAAAVLTGTNKPEDTPSAAAPTENAVAAKPELVANPESDDGDMKIVEAAYQNESGIKPVTPESLSEEASLAVDSNNEELGKVMVKGSYYPKAVYNNADFSSSLLMRVSPGTQLLVSKAIGPWLEVKTEKGIGYVHSRDIK